MMLLRPPCRHYVSVHLIVPDSQTQLTGALHVARSEHRHTHEVAESPEERRVIQHWLHKMWLVSSLLQ
jgi:hypothetical protein